MPDYDVIVRIPIRARDQREAQTEASYIEDAVGCVYGVESVSVECTGDSGEE